jgi:hypothetical protein
MKAQNANAIRRCNFPLMLFLILGCIIASYGQVQSQTTDVYGRVYDLETGRDVPYAFVINFRTQQGVFCDGRGRFHIRIQQSDTLIVSVTGYDMRKYSLKDSIPKARYDVEFGLKVRPMELRTFTVKAPKTYDQIVRELEKIERMKAKQTSFADAVNSPITYLYAQFNRTERAKRKIAELEAEDARVELMKELFAKYLVANIIEMDDDERELDDFIRFSGITQSALTFETEYELVVHIKAQFDRYQKIRGILKD